MTLTAIRVESHSAASALRIPFYHKSLRLDSDLCIHYSIVQWGRVKRSELQLITRHYIIRTTMTIEEQRDVECVITLDRRKISAT